MSAPAVDVRAVEALPLQVPLKEPLKTSFGVMDARSALLVALTDAEGRTGWGEVWCNFPTFGALHRARLAERIVGPLLTEMAPVDPWTIGASLQDRLAVLALQTGEFGPFAQVVGGLEMAVWDLSGQAAAAPIHRLMGSSADRVPAYASGINPTDPGETVRAAQADGFRAFKLKVGFGRERDLENVAEVASALNPGETFMVDANQAWEAGTACAMAEAMAGHGPSWLEEPLRADASEADWRQVAAAGLPIAAGENWRGTGPFEAALEAGWLAVANRTRASGAGSRAVSWWRGGRGRLACGSARTISAALWALLRPLTFSRPPAATGCWRSTPTRTRCAPRSWDRSPPLRAAHSCCPRAAGLGLAPDLAAIAAYRVET